MPHPTARITAELRDRIVRGALAPGDRVPSTRAIAREWGVAVATATKVLAALRDEGLVRAVPGVGTVVRAAPSHRGGAGRSRPVPDTTTAAPGVERIVAAAVAVADAEGLEGVSMRRVAAEVGTGPMSLYRHVADKEDLLLRMLDAAMREWRPPAVDGADWRECLEAACRGLWWLFRRHPWLASALSLTRPQAVAGGLAYTEWVLSVLDTAGLAPTDAFDVHLVLFTFVRGTAANVEHEHAAAAATGLSAEEHAGRQVPRLRAIAAGGAFPHLERLLDGGYDLDLDALFERGLRHLLDGLAAERAR